MAKLLACGLLLLMLFVCPVFAQTTEFSYQGSLKDGVSLANGNYDFEFALFDALSAGNQIGATIPKNNVAVANGIFSVKLDFGSVFPGTDRFLEIRVRLTGQPGITTLAPRQLVNSAPYSVKSLNTDTATNATQLGGIAANQYVTTTNGGANFIQNLTAGQQTGSFNITGNGNANIFNASTQYNIGGSRVLGSSAAQSNLFVGFGAGQSITTSFNNSFFGTVAGGANTTGEANSFFGSIAGGQNTSGVFNSFFGVEAGGSNTMGSLNSFFGLNAGKLNTTGSNNSFFGNNAGLINTTGNNNTILGYDANVGSNSLSFATAIGSGSTVSASNTISLGRSAGQDSVQIPGPLNVTGSSTFGGTLGANVVNATTQYNIGGSRVLTNAGTNNLIAGVGAGPNIGGQNNSFFGTSTGSSNFNGRDNAMFGFNANVQENPGGDADGNSLFGSSTRGASDSKELTLIGFAASTPGLVAALNNATAIGARSRVTASNSLVLGSINGINNATADTNVGIGTTAPNHRLTVGPTEMPVITNAIAGVYAAGATYSIVRDTTSDVEGLFGAEVSGVLYGSMTNHRVALRTNNNDRITIASTGEVAISTLGSAGADHLCYNASLQISTCSSSLRYKTNIGQFSYGLSFVNKLRPISFDWKDGGMKDLGLAAEDVEKVDPLLVTYNAKGEVEGVKYDRIGVVLVNAVKEQQSVIESQQQKIETLEDQVKALILLVCTNNKDAEICKQQVQ